MLISKWREHGRCVKSPNVGSSRSRGYACADAGDICEPPWSPYQGNDESNISVETEDAHSGNDEVGFWKVKLGNKEAEEQAQSPLKRD